VYEMADILGQQQMMKLLGKNLRKNYYRKNESMARENRGWEGLGNDGKNRNQAEATAPKANGALRRSKLKI